MEKCEGRPARAALCGFSRYAMKKKFVLDILKEVEAGRLSADDALTRLKLEPIEELGFARVDLHRELRQGAT